MGSTSSNRPFGELHVAYVELFVEDLSASVSELVEQYGFTVTGTAGSPDAGFRSTALRQADAVLVVTQATSASHPAHAFTSRHGDGVADIALYTANPWETCARAVSGGGAETVSASGFRTREPVPCVTGFGDVVHTLVLGGDDASHLPAGFEPTADVSEPLGRHAGLTGIDHFAVLVESGDLDATVDHYIRTLGLQMIFEERTVVGGQGMISKVVEAAGGVTLTCIQPDPEAEPGIINAFLKGHGGAGIQHVAFTADDAVESVAALNERGVEFLSTPGAYYDVLTDRITLNRHTVSELRDLNLLVDEDHDGQLFQIFTRSTHPHNTYFYEIVERLGARTFGSSNIKALYEAIKMESAKESATAGAADMSA